MVQSWENFFDPSGGSFSNSLQFGGISLLIDFGSSFVNKYIHDPLEKMEKKKMIQGVLGTARTNIGALPTNYPVRQGMGYVDIVDPYRAQAIRRGAWAEARGIRSSSLSKYTSLKRGAKLIGKGYLALAAASIAESIVTPGYSQAATASNEQIFGGTLLDSQGAYTQRQRAIQAIHDSQLGLRNVIGAEANYFHK